MTKNNGSAPEAVPEPELAPDGGSLMDNMMELTLEEAHREALELIGEQQVSIRVLTKRLRVAAQMLEAQQHGTTEREGAKVEQAS